MTSEQKTKTSKGITHYIRMVFSRAFVFYVFLFALSMLLIDYDKGKTGLEVRTLEKQVPDLTYLLTHVEGKGDFDKKRLLEYIYFYSKVIEYKPQSADAYSMLGFCYYKIGEVNRAIAAYKRA